jgi:hypothetical protein
VQCAKISDNRSQMPYFIEGPQKKRRKLRDPAQIQADQILGDEINLYDPNFNMSMNVDMDAMMGIGGTRLFLMMNHSIHPFQMTY